MKVQIIGLGIVGTAQACLCQKLKHEIIGYDVALNNHPYCETNNCIIGDVDMTFICTPESAVESVIESLVNIGNTGIIVVKSTVPIGTIEQLSKKFGAHICHNPEFLREQYHLEEVLSPNMTVIGECCKEHGDILEAFYMPINKPIVRGNSKTSELVKLAINAHLSTLITFWNEINELCHELGLETKNISDIICRDPRISNYGCDFFGKPYAGKCLPKDMMHLISGFRGQGLNPKLFEACEGFNERITENAKEKVKE